MVNLLTVHWFVHDSAGKLEVSLQSPGHEPDGETVRHLMD